MNNGPSTITTTERPERESESIDTEIIKRDSKACVRINVFESKWFNINRRVRQRCFKNIYKIE